MNVKLIDAKMCPNCNWVTDCGYSHCPHCTEEESA